VGPWCWLVPPSDLMPGKLDRQENGVHCLMMPTTHRIPTTCRPTHINVNAVHKGIDKR
jgi:hypothetical protein